MQLIQELKFKGDSLGGSEETPITKDRVLNVACLDEIPTPFSKAYFHDQVIWQSGNKQLIKELELQWGDKPDWFGYDRMKKK